MVLYDDKTKNAIKTGNQLLIPSINCAEDITFKASYIVAANLNCAGKISALFDLIVFGDVHADEINVKGRFVCMGRCCVSGMIVVHDDIWCEDMQTASVTCHGGIVAQSVAADNVVAEENIIIGKTLAIEEKAHTYQNLICGETAYGAGRIIASKILTAEPLDLDDGEEAIESPFQYTPKFTSRGMTEIENESVKYAKINDYKAYLSVLMKVSDESLKKQFERYALLLRAVEMAYPKSISDFKDVSLLIGLMEIVHSQYFQGWDKVVEWTDSVLAHFKNVVEGRASITNEMKPATALRKGYTVLHQKYGKGTVGSVLQVTMNGKISSVAKVNFDNHGEKKFPLPDALKFFTILSEKELLTADEIKESLQCGINSYAEWLNSLQVINQYKEFLGNNLYDLIYSLLLAKLGLKPKFIEDRFKEKGWN